tara:strand:+ start:151 stop:1392 length:1242 start_codon:yes stop_codon:yes gene_type:complete
MPRGDNFAKYQQDKFKKSVAKARARGIDTRTTKQKERNWKKEAEDRASRAGAGDGDRSQALQRAALQPTVDKYEFLSDQDRRRREMEEAFRTGKNVRKSDFTGYTDGLFGLRIGDFKDTGRPKLREGLSSADYADYMRGLYDLNPQMMQQIFPVGSGKVARQIFTPTPFKMLGQMGVDVGSKIGEGLRSLLPEDLVKLPSRVMTDVKSAGTDFSNFLKKFGSNTDASIAEINEESEMTPNELMNKVIADQEERSRVSGLPNLIPGPTIEPVTMMGDLPPLPVNVSETAYDPSFDKRVQTSRDQQEQAYQDERLDNLLVDLGLVGGKPIEQQQKTQVETITPQEDIFTAEDVITGIAPDELLPLNTSADFDTGINTPKGQEALKILNSLNKAGGGYAQMSTYEKLKAMADSYGD